jgi:MFS family permease
MTWIMTTVYVVQGVGAIGWGLLSDRLVERGANEGQLRKGLLSLYQLSYAAAILGTAYATSTSGIFAWLLVAGVFGGIGGANSYCISQMYAGPEAAGRWVGVMNGIGNLSGVVGPILTGVLIQRTGSYFSAFVVSAIIVGLGAIWWSFAMPRVRLLTFSHPETSPQLA